MTAEEFNNQPLLIEFLAWIERAPRTYAETMDAWRTSCPRSSVWEDAWLEGLVAIEDPHPEAGEEMVSVTAKARGLIYETKRHAPSIKATGGARK
jgi:hypothetical protein